MNITNSILRHIGRWSCAVMAAFTSATNAVETMVVESEVIGTTPVVLGYNLGHFEKNSNAADWFRYSGANSARMFLNRSDLEKTDDKKPWGDGVTSQELFFVRRELLRVHAANPSEQLSDEFVNWDSFRSNLAESNGYPLTTLRDAGVEILVNITAGKPVEANDWAGRWELWQHYYAAAYVLSHQYGVKRYSMYNEPNHGNKIKEEPWLDLLLICSDAIQSAIQDVNSRYNLKLKPEIFAPNTAGGASKYNDKKQGKWGAIAMENRHRWLDGRIDRNWMNFHVFNYQKYTHRQYDEKGLSGFLDDYKALRALIDDNPGKPLPIALTEFNVQTAASYDRSENSPDHPFDSTSLGATLSGLSTSGIQQLYLFKFGQTAWKSTYGVKKNGTHFVQNASPYHYGGATRSAEVYRLFIKAASGARPIHRVTASASASPGLNKGLWNLATQDEAAEMAYLFLANRDDRNIEIDIDFSALAIPSGNPFCIEQVNASHLGSVVSHGHLQAGKIENIKMPPLSVWLISVPMKTAVTITKDAVADTQLRDGDKEAVSGGGSLSSLMVRSDASNNPRHVALIRIPVAEGDGSSHRRVLLEMDVASSVNGTLAQAHIYGIDHNHWSEESFTWQQAGEFLTSGTPVGNQIKNNAVKGHGTAARMLGQLTANSSSMVRMAIDVSDFARSRKDGFATFLIVQEHRWDVALPSMASGDTQAAHLKIGSRERQGRQAPRLLSFVSGHVPVIKNLPKSNQRQKLPSDPPNR